jgi:hypothetical protein
MRRLIPLAVIVIALAGAAFAQIRHDLALNEPDVSVRGSERFDYTGAALAAGDLNGDGATDFVVGSFLTDGPDGSRTDAGLVTVHFGAPLPSSGTEGAGPLRIHGAAAGDLAGFAVALADWNGDGIDDLAWSAPGRDGPDGSSRADSGAVYVLFGRFHRTHRFPLSIDLATESVDAVVHGADPYDTLGGPFLFQPVRFGFLNDDPYADLILGFPGGDGPDETRPSAGEVHVVFGSPSPESIVDLRDGGSTVVFGADEGDLMGVAVTSGDFDGDGIGDLVGGAKNSGGPLDLVVKAGEAVGIFGGDDLTGRIDLADGSGAFDFIVYGIDPLDRSSRSLASGDLDGDGIDDLVIGARHADGSAGDSESAGEAYVLLGHPMLSGEYFLEVDSALTVYGAEANDSVGYDVAAGDVNGDGIDDLIVGAQFADGEENRRGNCGEVVVLLGGGTFPRVVDLAVDAPDLRVEGERVRDSLGTAVASADWNADGIDDLLLGGPGRVYKQLTIPPPDSDLENISDGGGAWILLGAPVQGRLDRSPASVPPGSSFLLEMSLANLRDEDRPVRIRVNWIPADDPFSQGVALKTKDVFLEARRSITRSRTFPVSEAVSDGDYLVELVIESPPGTRVDRDRIPIRVETPVR